MTSNVLLRDASSIIRLSVRCKAANIASPTPAPSLSLGFSENSSEDPGSTSLASNALTRTSFSSARVLILASFSSSFCLYLSQSIVLCSSPRILSSLSSSMRLAISNRPLMVSSSLFVRTYSADSLLEFSLASRSASAMAPSIITCNESISAFIATGRTVSSFFKSARPTSTTLITCPCVVRVTAIS